MVIQQHIRCLAQSFSKPKALLALHFDSKPEVVSRPFLYHAGAYWVIHAVHCSSSSLIYPRQHEWDSFINGTLFQKWEDCNYWIFKAQNTNLRKGYFWWHILTAKVTLCIFASACIACKKLLDLESFTTLFFLPMWSLVPACALVCSFLVIKDEAFRWQKLPSLLSWVLNLLQAWAYHCFSLWHVTGITFDSRREFTVLFKMLSMQ